MNSLTSFPNFTELEGLDLQQVQQLVKGFEPYSDFNLISLYSWNIDGSAKVSVLNNNLVISIPDYLDGDPVVSILGKTDVDGSLHTLLSAHKSLKMVPEVVIRNIDQPQNFEISEDLDNFDYIYSLEQLANLRGPDFRSKRKRLAKLLRENTTLSFQDIDTNRADYTKRVLDLFDKWAGANSSSNSNNKDSEIFLERKALNRLLQSALFGEELVLTLMVLDGQDIGFSINEYATECSTCHFQKTLLENKNMDIVLTNYVSKLLHEKGSKAINWEQDLGIEGLRQFKQSYQPIAYLKKFNISPN